MYTHFTDAELVNFVLNRGDLTPLEAELVARLERALDGVDLSTPSITLMTQAELFENGGTAIVESEA